MARPTVAHHLDKFLAENLTLISAMYVLMSNSGWIARYINLKPRFSLYNFARMFSVPYVHGSDLRKYSPLVKTASWANNYTGNDNLPYFLKYGNLGTINIYGYIFTMFFMVPKLPYFFTMWSIFYHIFTILLWSTIYHIFYHIMCSAT